MRFGIHAGLALAFAAAAAPVAGAQTATATVRDSAAAQPNDTVAPTPIQLALADTLMMVAQILELLCKGFKG